MGLRGLLIDDLLRGIENERPAIERGGIDAKQIPIADLPITSSFLLLLYGNLNPQIDTLGGIEAEHRL